MLIGFCRRQPYDGPSFRGEYHAQPVRKGGRGLLRLLMPARSKLVRYVDAAARPRPAMRQPRHAGRKFRRATNCGIAVGGFQGATTRGSGLKQAARLRNWAACFTPLLLHGFCRKPVPNSRRDPLAVAYLSDGGPGLDVPFELLANKVSARGSEL